MNKIPLSVRIFLGPPAWGFGAIKKLFDKIIGKDCVALSQMLLFIFAIVAMIDLHLNQYHIANIFVMALISITLSYWYLQFKDHVEKNGYNTNDIVVLPTWVKTIISLFILVCTMMWVFLIIFILDPNLKLAIVYLRYELEGIVLISFVNFGGPKKTIWADVKQKVKEKLSVKALHPSRISS